MALSLKTGFEDIYYEHLSLRKSMIDHGRKLYESDHVFSVTETREPGKDTGSDI